MLEYYDIIHNLPEIEIFSNYSKILTFTAYDSTGTILHSLWGCNISWKLYHYEELLDNPIIEKTGELINENQFSVTLTYSDTDITTGKYVQQIVLTDYNNNVFVCARGFVTVLI